MDGVLADSEPVYLEAVNAVLESLDKQMSRALHEAIIGHGVEATWEVLIDELGLPGKLEDYLGPYDKELVERLGKRSTPLPGVRELVETLRRRGTPIAVASSSWPGWIEALLGGIGLADAFEVKVSATMVEHPKPAPDLYLLAAERIGVDPANCVAIEDTGTGLRAAKAAGMYAVQVRASSMAFPPLPEADAVIETLHDFDLSLLADD